MAYLLNRHTTSAVVPWLATSHAISKNHWLFSAIDFPPSSSRRYSVSVTFFDCKLSRLSRLLALDMFLFQTISRFVTIIYTQYQQKAK